MEKPNIAQACSCNDEGDEDSEQEGRSDGALLLDEVSAFAGDRVLTEKEKTAFEVRNKNRGEKFFSDLLYTITHQHFAPVLAKDLWEEILKHKYDMSAILKRNIRITVAALDYLSNFKNELPSPTVIDETRIAAIVELSLRDGLTKLYNHSMCFQKIKDELSRFNRYGTVVSIMMIDIDDFKKINDCFGHVEGDRILSMLGAILKEETRHADISCRYGGEEFAIILPSTEIKEASVLAGRVRDKVEKSMPLDRKITVSIGVASCSEKVNTAQLLVEKADAALYSAKSQGKNRVLIGLEFEEEK